MILELIKKLLWIVISLLDSNRGYKTPLQRRYVKGDLCKMSMFKLRDTILHYNESVVILDVACGDYLVQSTTRNIEQIVYQFELTK